MTSNARAQTTNRKRNAIRKALLEEERTWVWLARKTGYSPGHLRDVDAGREEGTPKFWIAVRSVLGDRLETRVA